VIPGDINAGYCLIADMQHLQAEIDIPEQELKAIRIGQPCGVTTEAFPDRRYEGRVEWFSPVANRQRAIRRAKIAILNPDDRLLPDLSCRVQIRKQAAPEGARETLRVPRAAVLEEAGESHVFVLEEGKSRRRPVKLGPATGATIEVREGLQEGEVVLIPGDAPLTDGQLVRPRTTAKKL